MPVLAENKRAFYDYEILEKYGAGIQLAGFETKSARLGRMNLAGAYALIRNDEAWLLNADIPPYQVANTPPEYDPRRTRKLLLKKSEIKELIGKLSQKGLTLLPLKAYTKGRRNLVKIELGLARGRKTRDRREYLRKKEALKEIGRTLKQY